jgi:hypothetical protein
MGTLYIKKIVHPFPSEIVHIWQRKNNSEGSSNICYEKILVF